MSTERDFIAEMRSICEQAISDTEQPNPVVAADLVEKLQANDPELLAGWLLARAQSIVADYLGRLDATGRRHARAMAPGRAFAEAAAKHEAGDPDAFHGFSARYVINEEGARRRVSDMRGVDHRFVADSYAASAKRDQFLASVHRAVAKRVGNRTTAEVFTEAEYAAMFGETVKPAEGKSAAA